MFKNITAICCLALVLSSCGGGENQDDKVNTDVPVVKDTTPITVDEETKFKFDFAIANIPSPVEGVNEISKWGVGYNNELLNDPKNSSKYASEFSKAINLGIYNIDMSYGIVNERGQDVLKYMKTVLILSDALGLKGAVDQMIGKRAEENIGSKDSLLRILDEILVKSDSYLRTNERVYTAGVVFAGSWVEGLYLTCKIAESTSNGEAREKAYKHLWEQRFHLGNLITLLDDYKNKKEAVELNNEFRTIHKEINDIKNPKDLDDNKFKSISTKIYALRGKLTN